MSVGHVTHGIKVFLVEILRNWQLVFSVADWESNEKLNLETILL